MASPTLIRRPEEITSAWLSGVLGTELLELDSVEPVGTGQMSQSHRARFTSGEGSRGSVIVKLASDDATSRATGVGMGAYYREIAFYRDLAPRIGGPLARCLLAEYDPAEGWFTLVLEDAGGTQGDQIDGCSREQAELALRALARLHAPVLNDLSLGAANFLNQPNPLHQALLRQLLPAFKERYSDRVSDAHLELCERFIEGVDAWSADRRPPLGLVHGDYRLDNLLFDEAGCTVVDWQTVGWGSALLDASYFIGGCLRVEERRRHERELLGAYHEALLEAGVRALSFEQCWEEYRRSCFAGILMAIAAPMVVVRTERGDDMFMSWLARSAQQAIDLEAVALLPESSARRLPPLVPEPADEGTHPPGLEPLWNESWYFDAVGDDEQLGVYVRLGRLPNHGACLYTACICGPGRPSIMLVDGAAPLPAASDEHQALDTEVLHARQLCEQPLQRFRVSLRGVAQAHEDPAAPLRAEAGTAVEIDLGLTWETDGTPYAWRQSTRYEIPCRVSGTVTIGEERIDFSGSGQRDHSWGARDWWALDWMWSALHLADGTHLHAVGVPQMPGYGVGYVQHDGRIEEIESVHASERDSDSGLPVSATIRCGPPALELEVQPLAYGALRLEAPDGRLSLFPRAMCRVSSADGRRGSGWVEWNRVQRPAG